MFGIYLKIAGNRHIVVRALWVALVVGIILNLINEWTILVSGNFSEMNILTVSLTFVVPYLVSSFSSVLSEVSLHPGDIYWVTEMSGKIVLAVADGTGHGVPGAFIRTA